jgi:hypothetical protein
LKKNCVQRPTLGAPRDRCGECRSAPPLRVGHLCNDLPMICACCGLAGAGGIQAEIFRNPLISAEKQATKKVSKVVCVALCCYTGGAGMSIQGRPAGRASGVYALRHSQGHRLGLTDWKTACKTFQIPGVNSVQ